MKRIALAAACLLSAGFWATAGENAAVDPLPFPCNVADFDGSGVVDGDDLGSFVSCYFAELQSPGSCPESWVSNGAGGPRSDGDLAYFLELYNWCLATQE